MKKFISITIFPIFLLLFSFSSADSFAQALSQGFNTTTFPPTGWTQTTGLWNYISQSGFCVGTGSAQANFYGVSSGTFDLTSPSFTATGPTDSLVFQDAYASYSGEDDQLQIMYSTNGGTTFTQLVLLHGGASGALVTAPPQTAIFSPTCTQWKYQRLVLPAGTNKLKFNGISAFGNDLYIDSIYVKNVILPPATPTLLTPANHRIDMPLSNDTLSWTPSSGATNYNLIISLDSLGTSVVYNDTTLTGTAYIFSGFSPLLNWWWKVRAKNTGGWSAFTVPWVFRTKGPATSPSLITPVNNATNQPIAFTHNWSRAVDQTFKPHALNLTMVPVGEQINSSAQKSPFLRQMSPEAITNYWYELYTDTTTAAVIKDSTLTDTTRAVAGLLNNTNYWWRVKAKNDVGWGPFSSYFKFTTVVAVPPAPTNIYPANNSTGIIPTTLIDWSTSAGATQYRLQVSTDSTFGTSIMDTIQTVDSIHTPTGRLANNIKYYWHVRAQNVGGNSAYGPTWNFTTSLTGVSSNGGEIPKVFKLYQAYPNPFNPATVIKFDLPQTGAVKMEIFNMLGQVVGTLVNGSYAAGSYSVTWDAANFSSGVYFYRINAGNYTDIHKMVLVK